MEYQEDQENIFLFFDAVTLDSAADAISWIIGRNSVEEKPDFITMIINSQGGDITAGFAVIDFMKNSEIPIHTVGTGQILSCGLMIFMAGSKGNRSLTKNTSVLSHVFSGNSEGSFHNIKAMGKEFDYAYERLVNFYLDATSLSKEEIESTLLTMNDVFLTPEDALKYGLCDKII